MKCFYQRNKIRFAALVVLGCLVSTGGAQAEVAAADPIDLAMRQCLARRDRSSSDGQILCMDEARQKWQTAMNRAMQQLSANGSARIQRKWKESQRRWLEWRKDELCLVKVVYDTTQGTMYTMARAEVLLQPVRDRALALRLAAEQVGPAAHGRPAVVVRRPHPCARDARCAHAMTDVGRYYRKLQKKMPVRSRGVLTRAQRSWAVFRDATTPLLTDDARANMIGTRVATLKRFSETVGNH